MTPFPTTWVEINPGMYVRGTDGSTWRCDRREYSDGVWAFWLVNRAGVGAWVYKKPDEPVEGLVPTMEEAEQIVAARLPVAGVQRRIIAMEIVATHPDSKWRRAALAAHLLHMHHVSIAPASHLENDDMPGLLEAHALAHADPIKVPVPHVHVAANEL